MSFTPELLQQNINSFSNAKVIWVAYSGGCDSHALLHSEFIYGQKLNLKLKQFILIMV